MSDKVCNCAKERANILKKARCIVVKVGSAVLTDPEGLNLKIMRSLAKQIAELMEDKSTQRQIVLVSSGSVSAGKSVLKLNNKEELANYSRIKPAIAAVGQSLLMQAWNDAFAPWKILTGQVLLTREDLRSRSRFQTAAVTFSEMLSFGVLPIVNENDTVSVSGLKFGDNDFLASLLVNLVEADLFINLTSAPGVLDSNPQENPHAQVMKCISDIAQIKLEGLCGEKTEMGSGGMFSKLLAARRISQIGVPTLILPGREENILINSFENRDSSIESGTWISASKKYVPRRKFWLAYQSEPTGEVELDRGAANALLYEGRSLLPGGIKNVAGTFDKGALLRVVYNNENLGVGFTNYSSDDLVKIAGLKRHEVAAILGQAKYPDVIHRDNLLLDAAI